MRADFVSTSEWLWYFEKSEERVLLSPLCGSIFILKYNGYDHKFLLLFDGVLFIHGKANECLFVLKNSE